MHTGDAFIRYGYPYVNLNNVGSIKGIMGGFGIYCITLRWSDSYYARAWKLEFQTKCAWIKEFANEPLPKTVIGLDKRLNYIEIADSVDETLAADPIMPKAKLTKLNYIKSIELESKK